jgi:hypothetical protein
MTLPPAIPRPVPPLPPLLAPTTAARIKATVGRQARESDVTILRLIAMYRIMVYPVWAWAIYGDESRNIGHVARHLQDLELIENVSRSLPGGMSYFHLKPKACSLLGLRKDLATVNANNLSLHLAVLWFCFMDCPTVRRHRLEYDELCSEAFFKEQPPSASLCHVASTELGYPCVFRVIQPAAKRGNIVKILKAETAKVSRHRSISPWFDSGQYGFAVLGATETNVKDIRRDLACSGLLDEIPIIVGHGPTSVTIAEALKAFRKEQAQ